MKVTILQKPQPDKDGKHLLFFRIYLNNKPFKISSEIKVPNGILKNGMITTSPEFKKGTSLNTLLQLRKSILEQAEDAAMIEGEKLTPDYVKKYYSLKTGKEEQVKPKTETMNSEGLEYTFFEFVDWFMDKYSTTKANGYLRQFVHLRDHVKAFKPDMRWEDFTEDFWINYVNYLIEDKVVILKNGERKIKAGLKNVSIQSHLKRLHTLMDRAIKKNYPVPAEFMEIKFSIEEKQPFWASWEEVQLIKNAPCISKAEEVIRDSFVVSANLGIRNSDFNMINENSVYFNNGRPMLRLVVVKTKLDYSLPITDEVWKILQKYNLRIPKYHQYTYNSYIKNIAERVVDATPYREVNYSGSRRIETTVPRHKKFSTHTARRTFGRRWLDKGGSMIMLQKIFGHKSPETTLKYIGYNSFEMEKEFIKVMGH